MLTCLIADWRHMTGAWDASPTGVLMRGLLRSLFAPSLTAVLLHRLAHAAYRRPGLRWLAQLLKARSIRRCAVEIHPAAQIGPGFALVHGIGLVIGHEVVAGRNLVIYQNVTLGHAGNAADGQPTIGDGVRIGAGAVVLGGVHVGDHARIGANAVVLADVPAAQVVTGVWKTRQSAR